MSLNFFIPFQVLEGKENDPQIHEIHENEGFEDDEGIAESGM